MTSTALQLRQDTYTNICASTGLVQGEVAFDVTRGAILAGSSGGAGGMHWITPFTGTWTPTIVGDTTPGGQTYSRQIGYYTKISTLVIAQCRITVVNTTAGTGAADIGGLPFAAASQSSNYWGGSVGWIASVAHQSTSYNQFGCVVVMSSAGTLGRITESGGNAALGTVNITQLSTAGADMVLTFIYQAATDST